VLDTEALKMRVDVVSNRGICETRKTTNI